MHARLRKLQTSEDKDKGGNKKNMILKSASLMIY